MKRSWLFIVIGILLAAVRGEAQKTPGPALDKMPAGLETDFALSALPAHLRSGATVYLLDPAKGYYVGRQGSNGFVCFISRTDWEWAEFRKDIITPIAFDPEGARTIFPVYRDVAAMRASGKFTAIQIRDSIVKRIRSKQYVAPARTGISFMLAPVMRVYTGKPGDRTVETMSMPHYMFYAPYVLDSDVGTGPDSGPVLLNPGSTVLGERKGPFGYIIMAASPEATAKIRADGKDLVRRLVEFSPLFKIDNGMMHR